MKTTENKIIQKNKNRKAFSMLELIFVIIVLGILASIAIPNLSATRSDAKAVSVKSDTKLAMDSIIAYYTAKGDIEDISKAVTLDNTRWSVTNNTNSTSNLAYIFKTKSNDKECLRIEIDDSEETDKQFTIAIAKNATGTSGNDDAVCRQLRTLYNKLEDGNDSLSGSSINSSPIYYIKILSLSLDNTGINF
jgi:prepilin-type N-terminal cleavage/methylation domain-containing protein